MEKQKNGFYKAVSILLYVLASLYSFYVLMALCLVVFNTNAEIVQSTLNEISSEALNIPYTGVQAALILMLFFIAGITALIFVEAARFNRFSALTNEEANKFWGKCVAWVIVSYFFGGLLIGGLATAGLCVIQNKQRKEYLESLTNKNVKENQKEETEDKYSIENLEAMHTKFIKIKELKDMGAISDDEYESLRKKIIGKEEKKAVSSENNDEFNKMAQRLEKIKQLKDMGAVSDEEYEDLRQKILDSKN